MSAAFSDRQLLELAVVMGLRKGLGIIRGARRTFSEDEQSRIAAAIVEHLKLANYRVRRGPPARGGADRDLPIQDELDIEL